jgi:hypothetical protein
MKSELFRKDAHCAKIKERRGRNKSSSNGFGVVVHCAAWADLAPYRPVGPDTSGRRIRSNETNELVYALNHCIDVA